MLTWRNMILHVTHNSMAGGHPGAHALEQRVAEQAWWPRLSKNCHSWCMRCVVCRTIKGRVHGTAFSRSERYTASFRALCIDLVGPLSPESDDCDYIVTTMDMFSLWLWLTAISGKTPQAVAEALYKYVYLDLAGFPMILRSDNGSEFTAELTRDLNRLIGTAGLQLSVPPAESRAPGRES